ncbi:hypothetical protein TNCT_617211 [Trichonephila clavata]|uniref:FLYWCH-type domain-containing protein n=1 Tax=Trichonephila clavata TaxID=2740835 RepID=A0A8X6F4T1_TRICU|nr:hypothetical protein TNCT_617211 [Trichonephila clavata]
MIKKKLEDYKRNTAMFTPVEFSIGARGNRCLNVNGYVYTKKHSHNFKIYWRCAFYRKLNCKALVHSEGDYVVKSCGIHNHPRMSPYQFSNCD